MKSHHLKFSNRRFITLFFVILLICLIPLAYIQTRKPSDVRAGWFNDHYGYRQRFSFTHNAAISSERAITVTLDTAELITDGVMQADCDDTRFTDANGAELKFDLTGTCNNASTTYEVIFPSIINGTQYAYVYYDNPNAPNAEIDSTSYTALTPSGGDPSAITTRTNEDVGPSPVAYWSFDEGTGQTVEDATSNGNDGTLGADSGSDTDDPTWATEDQCISGKCLEFDGTADYVTLPKTVLKDNGTVGVWINPKSISDRQHILYAGASGEDGWSPGPEFQLSIDTDGAVDFNYFNSVGKVFILSTPALSSADHWYYLSAVWSDDSNIAKLYLDGQEVDSVSVNVGSLEPELWESSIHIGRSSTAAANGRYMNGFVDEFKVYPYARTAAEIKQDYNSGAGVVLGAQDQSFLSDGLVGYWPMDESSGTDVADESGNGNDGTLTNAQETGTSDGSGNSTTTLVDTDGTLSSTDDAYNGMILYITDDDTCPLTADDQRLISDYDGTTQTFTVSTAFSAAVDTCVYTVRHQVGGKFGNGMEFDATDDYVSTGDYESTFQDDFTLSAWVRTNDGNSAVIQNIFGVQNTSFGRISAHIHTNGNLFFTLDTENVSEIYPTNGTYSFSDGPSEWTHLTFTVVGSDTSDYAMKIYANGELVKWGSLSGLLLSEINTSSKNLYIGANNDSTPEKYFYGDIDEARIYNRALSAGEVKDLYNWAPGPVGYWDFEEGSGTTVNDSSGNGNTGTISSLSNVSWINGKKGKALSFDGSGYITVPYDDSINTLTHTVSFWLYANDGESCGAGHKELYGGMNYQFYRYDDGGSCSYTPRYPAGFQATHTFAVSNPPFAADNWNHIAVTVDGTQGKAYLNGQLVNTDASMDLINTITSSNLYLGSWDSSATNNWNGYIDDLKIYNYARTQEQILADMEGSTSQVSGKKLPTPVAYWSFDEMSGQTAYNRHPELVSGSDGNGTLGASSASSTDDPTWTDAESCKTNGCLDFDAGDYVQASTTLPTGDFSYTGWFNSDSVTSNRTIFMSPTSSGGDEIYLRVTSGGVLGYIVDIGSQVNGTTALSADTWYHFALVRNSGSIKLYLNGKQESSSTDSDTLDFGSCPFYVGVDIDSGGCATSLGEYFDGSIDEVKVYNVALSPEQVAQDYNANAAINFGGTSASKKSIITGGAGSAPVGYWDFNDLSGQSLTDRSGNGNNGTLGASSSTGSDDPEWILAGKSGGALEFDGSDDYAFLSDSSALNTGADFTISTWVKSSAAGTLQTFANMGAEFDWLYNLYYHSTNTLNCKLYQANSGSEYLQAYTSTDYRDGSWHQITCRVSGTQLDLFVDGNLVASDATPTGSRDTSTAGTFAFGRFNYSTPYHFNGFIDETKIWDYALSQSQIAYEYNQGKPVGYWKLDECQGTTINDASGNSNSGTLTIGATGSNTSVGTCNSGTSTEAWNNGTTGKYGASMSFDGTDDYFTISQPNIQTSPNLFTITGWIKPDSHSSYFITPNSNGIDQFVGYEGGNQRIFVSTVESADTNGYTLFSSIGSVPIGGWTHIAITIDNRDIQIFTNGVLNNSGTKSENIGGWTGTWYIGQRSNSSQWFDGQMDDLQVYNYRLSAAQVKNLYNGGGAVRFE